MIQTQEYVKQEDVGNANGLSLGINLSHNPSIAVFQDKKIIDFYNEERFVLLKNMDYDDPYIRDHIYLRSALEKIKSPIKHIEYTSASLNMPRVETMIKNIQIQFDSPSFNYDETKHHIYHAICGFYFSSFNEANVIVIDGGGAEEFYPSYLETESIYFINKKLIVPYFKHHSNIKSKYNLNQIYNSESTRRYLNGCEHIFSDELTGGVIFNELCHKIGLGDGNQAGLAMGLSSYAYTNKKFNNLDYNKVEACKIAQEKIFKNTCVLIEKIIKLNKSKNVILSGGCALNCSNNFKYVKRYPKLNFFVDPIPADSGTAIGAILYNEIYRVK